jgi:hypothetical protein
MLTNEIPYRQYDLDLHLAQKLRIQNNRFCSFFYSFPASCLQELIYNINIQATVFTKLAPLFMLLRRWPIEEEYETGGGLA